MEGTTEPLIVVIGHPIAGNPSQFAMERALHAMDLDWRVLSFDVDPKDVGTALDGFAVTGIVGVLVDPSVADAAADWSSLRLARPEAEEPDSAVKSDASHVEVKADATANPDSTNPSTESSSGSSSSGSSTEQEHDSPSADSESQAPPQSVDCLSRNEEREFTASHQATTWLDEQVASHPGDRRIWLGDLLRHPISQQRLDEQVPAPPSLQQIETADVIVIGDSESDSLDLEIEDWPANDGSTLVVNCSGDSSIESDCRERGYRVLSADDIRIATLQRCLLCWTGQEPQTDLIRDAIEEYLGV
ncbi:MAG: hypothetical protein AB8B91_21825 [Rubripirellula sp.]